MQANRVVILVIAFVVIVAAFAGFLAMTQPVPEGTVRIVPVADVQFDMLNPLRGDKSPKAGTLWGSRQDPIPCGFLVTFIDGFSSPPHIHPVTYRGVVVEGLVHNDVPDAETVWLKPGTFWTQPAGEVHITSAKGSRNVAYIEIEKGPYLVLPTKDAFDRTETPIKLASDAMAWEDPKGTASGPMVAALAGNPTDDGIKRWMLKLPAQFTGSIWSDAPEFHAVVIQSSLEHEVLDQSPRTTLAAGSYFGSEGYVNHELTCGDGGTCLVYIRTNGTFEVNAK